MRPSSSLITDFHELWQSCAVKKEKYRTSTEIFVQDYMDQEFVAQLMQAPCVWVRSSSHLAAAVLEALVQVQSRYPAASCSVITVVGIHMAHTSQNGIVQVFNSVLEACPALPSESLEGAVARIFQEVHAQESLSKPSRIKRFVSRMLWIVRRQPARLSRIIFPRILNLMLHSESIHPKSADALFAEVILWLRNYSINASKKTFEVVTWSILHTLIFRGASFEESTGSSSNNLAKNKGLDLLPAAFESPGMQMLLIFILSYGQPELLFVRGLQKELEAQCLEEIQMPSESGKFLRPQRLNVLLLLLIMSRSLPGSQIQAQAQSLFQLAKEIRTKRPQLASHLVHATLVLCLSRHDIPSHFFAEVAGASLDQWLCQALLLPKKAKPNEEVEIYESAKDVLGKMLGLWSIKCVPDCIPTALSKRWKKTIALTRPSVHFSTIQMSFQPKYDDLKKYMAKQKLYHKSAKKKMHRKASQDLHENSSSKYARCSWSCTPDCITEAIFSFVGYKRLCRLACVDRKFSAIAQRSELWKALSWTTLSPKISKKRQRKAEEEFSLVASRQIRRSFDWRQNLITRLKVRRSILGKTNQRTGEPWKVCPHFWCHYIMKGKARRKKHLDSHNNLLLLKQKKGRWKVK